jgi:parvulin-like peptidyl-prolyl isomerase
MAVLIALGGVLYAHGAQAAQAVQSGDEVVCRVNGREIRRADVESETRRLLPSASYHGKLDASKQQLMRSSALQNLIDAELQLQDAERRRIEVSADEVERALHGVIARYPDEDAFESQLERAELDRKDVEAELRRRRLISRVKEQVADADQEVSPEQARGYYDENTASFVRPRRAIVRQILIRLAPLERSPPEWQAAIDRANAARRRVAAGESFAALAVELSDAPETEKHNGGLLGPVHSGQLEAELDSALWEIPEGGTSDPIQAFKGVYLLHVDRIEPVRPLRFEEIEENLRRHLQKRWSAERAERWLAELRARAEIEILDRALRP